MHTSRERLHDGEVVTRTIRLLRTIEAFKGKWFGITMVANQTGLPKGTVHRYLAIFVSEGILERHLHHPQYRKTEEEKRV